MPTCAVRGCRNRSGRGIKATFHLFPKNPEVRQKWVPITGRKNWTPGLRAVLCSDHFEEPCFDRTGQTTRLRLGALPTVGRFAPKNKNKEIFFKVPAEDEREKPQTHEAEAAKMGITTRSGRQLKGRTIPNMPVKILTKKPSENGVEPADPDDPAPPSPLPTTPTITTTTTSEPVMEFSGMEEAPMDSNAAANPDHFYCRTQSEMDALLKKSEQKIEYLKMKLDYLSSPNRLVKPEPPDWPQFRRVSLQKEAEQIRAFVKAGSKVLTNDNGNSENLIESDEQLRERLKEAENLQRQIKTLQQKNRRSKKRSKAKFIRYVVMIEPTSKSGKKGSAAALKEGEQEPEAAEETEAAPGLEQVSSLHDSILSHTASMVVGPNGLLDEKDKQIQDLQRKLKLSRHKEKRKNEQLEHLQEVIEMLKERCPEYSSQKEPAPQRRCSLCCSPLLKRCHRLATNFAALDMTVGQVSIPLSQFKPAECPPSPSPQLKSSVSRLPWSQINRTPLCPDCKLLVNRSRLKERSSLVHSLRPGC